MDRDRRKNLGFTCLSNKIKALALNLLALIGFYASLGQDYSLHVTPAVANDTLFIEYFVKYDGGAVPFLSFGAANFEIDIDTAALDFKNRSIKTHGYWSEDIQPTCYDTLELNTDNNPHVVVNVTGRIGGGCSDASTGITPGDSVSVGVVAIPILDCNAQTLLTIPSTVSYSHVNWDGQEWIDELGAIYSVNLPGAGLVVPLSGIGTFGFETSDTSFCDNERINLSVTGVDISAGLTYVFYHFDFSTSTTTPIATQTGADTSFTSTASNTFETGDSVYVEISSGTCLVQSQGVTLTVSGGGTNATISANPSSTCNLSELVLSGNQAGETWGWYYAGNFIGNATTDQSLLISGDNGSYYVVIESAAGCVDTTNQVSLTTLNLPNVAIDTVYGITTICAGDSLGLLVSDLRGHALDLPNNLGAMAVAPDVAAYDFDANTSFTVEAQVKTTDLSVMGIIQHADLLASLQGFRIEMTAGSVGAVVGDGISQAIFSGPFIADGLFHHIALAIWKKDSTGVLYVDGVEVDRIVHSSLSNDQTASNDLEIGNGFTGNFNGTIDEVRLWNRALDSAGVVQSMNVELKGGEPFLVGLWNFNDTLVANVVTDLSATNNDASINGTASFDIDGGFFESTATPTYVWSNGGTALAGNDFNTLNITSSGSYSVQVDNGVCTASSIPVDVSNSALSLVPLSDTTVCSGTNLLVQSGAGDTLTHRWEDLFLNSLAGDTNQFSITVANDTTVTLELSDGGCIANDTFNIFTISSLPAIDTANATDVTLDSLFFSWAPVAGAAHYEYHLVIDGVVIEAPWDSLGTDTLYGVGNLGPSLDTLVFTYRAISNCDTVEALSSTYIFGTCSEVDSIQDTAQIVFLADDSLAFVWPPVTNALSYQVRVDTNGANFHDWQTTASTDYQIGGLSNDTVCIAYRAIGNCDTSYSDTACYVSYDCDTDWSGVDTTKLYCSSSFKEILEAADTTAPDPGFFEGPGVNFGNNIWFFDPQEAGAGVHTISLIGCYGLDTTSFDSVLVQAAPCIEIVDTSDISVSLADPQAIYTDCDGQIYFSDNITNNLVRIDTFGNANVIAGVGSGTFGYTDGHTDTALFNTIFGVVVHPGNGLIYFTDNANHSIRVLDPVSSIVTTLSGGGIQLNTGANGDPGDSDSPLDADGIANTIFRNPWGIAFNGSFDTLYVSDNGNNKIKAMALSDNSVRTVIGNGGAANSDDSLLLAGISAPAQIKFDPATNRLYIGSEVQSGQIRFADFMVDSVLTFSTNPGINLTDGLSGNGPGFATHSQPIDVAPDGQGNLFILDQKFCALRQYSGLTDSVVTEIGNVGGSLFIPNDLCGKEDLLGQLSGDYRMNEPSALSVFVNGFVDIVDTKNLRLLRVAIEDFINSPNRNLDTLYCIDDAIDTLNPNTVAGFYTTIPPGAVVDTNGFWVFMPSDTGEYTINFNHTIGACQGAESSETYVAPLPVIDLGADTTLCAANYGIQTLIADTIFDSYQWYFKAPSDVAYSVLSDDTTNTIVLDTLGSYILEAATVFGCLSYDTIEVVTTPNVIPSIISDMADSICFGDTATLSVVNIGAGPGFVSYVWNTGDTTESIQVDYSDYFDVVVIDSGGCIGTDTIANIVKNRPFVCINTDSSFTNSSSLMYNEWRVGILAGDSSNTASSGFVDGNAYTSRFSTPYDLIKYEGALYVVEQGSNNIVRRIGLSDTSVTLFAGVPGFPSYTDSVGRLDARFSFPAGIVVDEVGNFYVSNQSSHIINLIANNDSVYTIAGNPFAPTFNDGIGTAANFDDPIDMVMDRDGFIYIADFDNHRIRQLNPVTGQVTTFAGSGTNASTNGTGLNASFNWPWGITRTMDGAIAVAEDGGHTIRKIGLDTSVVIWSGLAGTSGDFNDTVGAITSAVDARYFRPWGLGNDANGNVFIPDGQNHTIRMMTTDNRVITLAGVSGNSGNVNGRGEVATFNNPNSCFFDDSTNTLYIADKGNHNIRTLQQNKTVSVCPNTQIPLDGSCSNADSYRWLDTAGNVLSSIATYTATDSGVYILEITKDGCVNTDSIVVELNFAPTVTALLDTSICPGDSIALVATPDSSFASFQWVDITNGINLDTLSTQFVSDTANYVVFASDSNGCVVNDTATITFKTFPSATMQTLGTYCPEETDTIRIDTSQFAGIYDFTLWQDSTIADTQLIQMAGVYTANVHLDNGCVISLTDTAIYNVSPTTTITATGKVQSRYLSTFNSSLNQPTDIVQASNGEFFVTDRLNHVVYRIDASGNESVFAGAIGIAGSADAINPTNARFNTPRGLAIDKFDNLYVADVQNHVIRKISNVGVVTTFAGTGVAGHKNGVSDTAQFRRPSSVGVLGSGQVVVADEGNHVIRYINPLTKVVRTIGVVGAAATTDGAFGVAEFNQPASIYVHKSGPIYIGEQGAVRQINFGSTTVSTYDLANTGGDTYPANTSVVGLTSNNGNTIGISTGINDRLYTSTGDPNTLLVAGDSVSGFVDGRSDTARFDGTGGLTIAHNGRVYVTDVNNGAVRELRDSSYVNICSGDSIELSANAGGAYSWTGPNGFNSTSQNVFVQDSGVYVMQFTDGTTGCLGLDSIVVNLIPIPTINIDTIVALAGGPDTVFYCGGDTLTLIGNDTVTSGYIYTWEILGGAVLGSGNSLEVSGIEENIVLTITDTTTAALCSNSDTIRVQFFVDTLALGSDQTICADACTTLDAGAGYVSYLWSDSSTAQTLTVCAGGVFEVTATTVSGCLLRDTVDVSVNFLPNLSIAGNRVYASTFAGDGSIGALDNVLPLSASFNGPTDAALDSQGNLYIVDQGNEMIRRIDNSGQVTTVIALPNPSAIAINKDDEIFIALFDSSKIVRITPAGTRFDLTGNNTLGYQDGTLAQAEFHHPFGLAIDENNRIFVADAGNDAVRIIDLKNDLVSTIGVPFGGLNAPGTFTTATFQHPSEITIDENGDAYVATGGGVINVASQILKIDLRSETVSTFNSAGNDITYVSVNGITDNLMGEVIFSKAQPFVGIVDQQSGIATKYVGAGIPQSLDGFDTIARVHQPSGIEFDAINNVVYLVDQLGHRVRLFKDSSQVAYCTGDSAQLVASVSGGNAGVFSWNTGSSLNSTFASSPGEYTVTFTDGVTGCSSTDTITVSEVPNPSIANVSSDTTICLNDTVALSAQGTNVTDVVTWSFINTTLSDTVFVSSQLGADTILVDSSIVGTYIASISNGACDTSVEVTVTLTNVVSSIVATQDSLCYLESTLLDGRGSSSIAGIASYLWDTTSASGTISPVDLTSDTLSVTPSLSGINRYVLVVTDSVGCTALDSVDVVVGDSLIASFSLDTLHLCNNVVTGDSLSAVISGGFAPLTFNWSTLASSVLLTNTDSATVVIASAGLGADTAQIILSLTDASGCSMIDSVTTIVHDFVVQATVASDTTCPNEPNQLNANIVSGGVGGFNYLWSPSATLDADTIANPISTTGNNVTYQVIVIDSLTGCTDTSSIGVAVRDLIALIGSAADADTLNVCFGDSSFLDASNSNGGSIFASGSPYRYVWNQLVGDASGVGGAGDTLISDTIFGATEATVSQIELIVSDSLGCTDRDTVSIFWNNEITVNVLTDSMICLNILDSLQSVSSGGTGSLINNWSISSSFGANLSIIGASNLSEVDVLSAVNLDSSVVVLEVMDSLGCSSQDSALVITSQLIAGLIANVDTACAGASVLLTATDSLSIGTVSYDFGFGPQASNTITLSSLNDTTYTVVIVDSATNCLSTASVNVVIRDLNAVIGAVIASDTVMACFGDSIILDAINSNGGSPFSGGVYSYTWNQLSGDASGIGGAGDTLIADTVFGATAGTFSEIELIITDSLGCTDRDSLTLFWNNQITVDILTDSIICLNILDSLQSNSTGGLGTLANSWSIETSLGGNLNIVGANNLTDVNVLSNVNLDSSIVILEVTDSLGCTSSDSALVVTQQLIATLAANVDTACAGADVILTAGDSLSIGAVSFDFGFGPQSSNTITLNSSIDTTYTVVILDSATNCISTASVNVIIRNLDAIIGEAVDADTIAVCLLENHILDASNSSGGKTFTNGAPYRYQWNQLSGDANGIGSVGDTLISDTLFGGTATTFSQIELLLTDSIGCTDRDTLVVYWNDAVVVSISSDPFACLGSVDTLEGTATGGLGNYTYNWEVLTGLLGGQLTTVGVTNQSNLAVQGNVNMDSSFVKLTVTDSVGCFAADSVVIQTRQLFAFLASNFDTVCGGFPVLLTASDSLAVGGLAYDFGIGFQSEDTMSVSSLTTTTYSVTILDSATGCQASSTHDIVVEDIVLSVGPSDTIVCFSDSIVAVYANVTGGAAPLTYSWQMNLSTPTGSNNDTIYVVPAPLGSGVSTTYQVTVTDSLGCTQTTATVARFDEIQIGRNFEINLNAGSDTIICFNTALNIGGSPTAVRSGGANPTANFTYDWQSIGATLSPSGDSNPLFNPLVGGATYNVQLTVTDDNVPQCQAMDSLTIDVREIPVVEMPDTSFWCGADVLILPLTSVLYPGGTTYEWTLNTTTLSGADSSTYLVSSDGTYEFIVTDSIGCSDSDQTEVILRALPTITVSDLGTVICTNSSINLSANFSPAGGTFLWTHDGSGSIEEENNGVTVYNPGFSDDGQTLEFVGAYTTVCGTVTDTTSPQAATPPVALFDVVDTIVNTNEPVAYTDASIGTNLAYNWTFQLTPTTKLVEVTEGPHVIEYAEDGTFNSVLEVTDQTTTCTDTFSVNITVIGSNVLFVPNVFSPLAQNVDNQSLKVFGTNISDSEFEFTVYNRWGEVIYQTLSSTEAMNLGWTGVNQNNGNESEMGSYTYTLKGRFFDGKEIAKSGSVTLIR